MRNFVIAVTAWATACGCAVLADTAISSAREKPTAQPASGSTQGTTERVGTPTENPPAKEFLPGSAAAEHPALKRAPKTWIRVDPRRCDFSVFTHSGQALSGKFGSSEDILLVAEPGTILSNDNKTPVFHCGCAYINSHKGAVSLTTRLANVSIAAGASVIVEVLPATATVRVGVLPSSPATASVITRNRRARESFALHPGQEVVFSGGARTDGPKAFAVEKASTSVADVVAMARLKQPTGQPLRLLGTEGTEFRVSAPDTVAVRVGEIFAEVPAKLVVQTPVADVVASKNAIIDVDADPVAARLKSFSGPGDSAIVCGDKTFDLKPGQELLISAHKIEQSDLTPPDGVGRRRSEMFPLHDKLFAAISDFSMISFLNECEHVRPIKHAAAGEDKATLERLLKTAAVVQTISSKYGPYHSVVRAAHRRSAPAKYHRGGSA